MPLPYIYNDERVWMQIHTWWQGAPLPEGLIAHLHAELWFPLGQVVRGLVPLDTRIVLHKNPGHLFRYESALFPSGGGQGDIDVKRLDLDGDDDGTVETVVHTEIDTRNASNGWQNVRIKPRVEHSNGDVQLTSSDWPVWVQNGGTAPTTKPRMPGIVGRGWYDRGHDYQNPVLLNGGQKAMAGEIVRGVWPVELRLDAGSGGFPVTFSAVYVDPDFHTQPEDSDGGPQAVVLGKWNGPRRAPLNIDSTRFSDGLHHLVLRCEATRAGERLVALQYVPFVVDN
ncbi:MAG: hypothetical protein LC798_11125 [Chloroflexi bacterium]|nr:hypothetical protein [Chloroflexota bacterium]